MNIYIFNKINQNTKQLQKSKFVLNRAQQEQQNLRYRPKINMSNSYDEMPFDEYQNYEPKNKLKHRTIHIDPDIDMQYILHYQSLRYLPPNVDDRDLIIEALSVNEDALKYASDNLKNDRELVLTAISHYSHSFEYASKELQKDKYIILYADRRRLQEKNIVSTHKLGFNNYHDILNNKIAFVNQPNIIKLYNIDYDIDTNILTIYTLGGEEFKLYNVNPFTTINEIGNRIYNDIYIPYMNAEHMYSIKHKEIYLTYKNSHICPFNGNLTIEEYIRQNGQGGGYYQRKYEKYKNKYINAKYQL